MIWVTKGDSRSGGPHGSAGACGSRRLLGRSLAALCAVLAVLVASALASAPALALSQPGHVFSFYFGAPGNGDGEFQSPSGVAVDDQTGDVYVVDRKNNRVEEFKPHDEHGELSGEEYVRELKVADPTAVAVDNCTTTSGSCTQTEDPSVGDVYVAGAKKDNEVFKFTEAGTEIGTLKKYGQAGVKHEDNLGHIDGLAADTHGSLFVYQETGLEPVVASYDDAAPVNAPVSSLGVSVAAAAPGLAVDSHEGVFLGHIAAKGESQTNQEIVTEYTELHASEEGKLALAAELQGTTGTLQSPGIDYEETTAFAVNPAAVSGDQSDDLYLANVTGTNVTGTGIAKTTSVAAFDAKGGLIQRFSALGLSEGAGVAVDANGVVYVSDAASDKVYVFELEKPGQPTADGLSTQSLAPSATAANLTRLTAQVNSNGAPGGGYYFEYGTGSCPNSCTSTPPEDIAAGFDEQELSAEVQNLSPGTYHYRVVAEDGTVRSAEHTFTILDPLDGLPDGRGWEMVSPPEKGGAEPIVTGEAGEAIQAAEDGDAISYVSDGPMPAKTAEGSRAPEATQILSSRQEDAGWTSRDIATPNTVALGAVTDEPPEYKLFSSNLALALVEPVAFAGTPSLAAPPLSPPAEAGEPQENTIYLRDDRPLEPEESPAADCQNSPTSARCAYEEAVSDGEEMIPKNAGFVALMTRLNAPGHAEFDGGGGSSGILALDATPSLSHVVLVSHKDAPGLYEWSGNENPLELVSVPPPGSPSPRNSLLGATVSENSNTRHAISDDGSLVFWTGEYSTPTKEDHLYVRDTETQTPTLQLDVAQQGAVGTGPDNESPAEAVFQTASADGSKVFFTDSERLTKESDAVKGAPNLYVAELSTAGGPPTLQALRDLTPGEGADVLAGSQDGQQGGTIIGASEDGSYVYFVANGVLAPGATHGFCPRGETPRLDAGPCNLYVSHFNAARPEGEQWDTKFIAALSSDDQPDWDAEQPGRLSHLTSRVSPNGSYLAFMSDKSLTGYDNEDVTGAGHMDEEVYLYYAGEEDEPASESLVCASCNPTGARPVGVHDLGISTAEGVGLLVDRDDTWAEASKEEDSAHWLAGSIPGWTALDDLTAIYQSRYLSNSGRLFFDSPDHLVPGATGEKEKVYEYEPRGVGKCDGGGDCVALISAGASAPDVTERESVFLDASANGNDVFFLTAEKLVSQDADSNFDVYDAHVCETASPCPPPATGSTQPCEETSTCHGLGSSAPVFPQAASMSVAEGNPLQGVLGSNERAKSLTQAQLLAEALKTCGKDHNASERLACERTARRKYGPSLAQALKACKKDKSQSKRRACEKLIRYRYEPVGKTGKGAGAKKS